MENDKRPLSELVTDSNRIHRAGADAASSSSTTNNNNNNSNSAFITDYFLPHEAPIPTRVLQYVREQQKDSYINVNTNHNPRYVAAVEGDKETPSVEYRRDYLLQLSCEDTWHVQPSARAREPPTSAFLRSQGPSEDLGGVVELRDQLQSRVDLYQPLALEQQQQSRRNSNKKRSRGNSAAPVDRFIEKTSHLSRGFISMPSFERRHRRVDFAPIIIVPSDVTAPLTLYNIQALLERGVYEDSARYYMDRETGSVNRAETKPPFVYVTPGSFLDRDRYHVKFERFMVIDDVEKFLLSSDSPARWNQVCACFTTGKASQFRDWLPEEVRRQHAVHLPSRKEDGVKPSQWTHSINSISTDKLVCRPSLLFSFIKGFLPYFEEDKIPAAASEWRVETLRLRRSTLRQYEHIAVASDFWEKLFTFMDSHPSFKDYSVPEKKA